MRAQAGQVLVILLVSLLLGFYQPYAVAASSGAVIRIDPSQVSGNVNRLVLGNNFLGGKNGFNAKLFNDYGGGVWDPARKVFSEGMIRAVRQSGAAVLRWPGGGWLEKIAWRALVGSASKRPGHRFGLPEFLLFCEKVGATPLITLPIDRYSPEQIADLVEYLNAPNDHSNPNGGIDWAARRALDGRAAPWGVRWFEFGNESFNNRETISEQDYIRKFRSVRAAMKGVDPGVRLGAVLADNTSFEGGWSSTVVKALGPVMDFAIIHPYLPKVNRKAAEKFPLDELALAAVSSDADLIFRLKGYNRMIRKLTGRTDLHLAATEFNGDFVQEKPKPLRHSLASAVHNADFLRIFLDPQYHVKLATYWQMLNSYWGIIRGGLHPGKKSPLSFDPTFYVYRIYHRYLGERVVGMKIASPSFDFKGGLGVSSRIGVPEEGAWRDYQGKIPKGWNRRWFRKGDQSEQKGVLRVAFTGEDDPNYYHANRVIDVEPDRIYRIRVRARTVDLSGGKIGIAVEDGRGWTHAFEQPMNLSLTGTTPWSWLTIDFRTFYDTKKIRVLVRHIPSGRKLRGVAEFGEMKVMEKKSNLGAVPAVVGIASVSGSGGEVFAVILNKDLHRTIPTVLRVKGAYQVVDSDSMTGPNPYVTNLSGGKEDRIVLKKMDLRKEKDGSWVMDLPPLSVTGIRMERVLSGGANGS